jgi:zinc/manganese transport system ATP-binding protein
MSALHLDNLTLGYDRHPAVHHLDGEIAAGTLLAVVGPNGAGKSTLLRGLAGLIAPLDGAIHREGDRCAVAYLPQSTEIDRSFPISVFDLASSGIWPATGWFGGVRSDGTQRVIEALAAVGLSGFENRWIGTLSGGQMQRLMFARVMLQDARILLLDEPFNALDARTTADLLAIIHFWHGEGRTVIAALHDMALVREHFPHTLLLARSAVAWDRTAIVLTEPNLARARLMCEAFDDSADPCIASAPPRAA